MEGPEVIFEGNLATAAQQHAWKVKGCRWKDPGGRLCTRGEGHERDRENPNHRVRLTMVREYDVATGAQIREAVE